MSAAASTDTGPATAACAVGALRASIPPSLFGWVHQRGVWARVVGRLVWVMGGSGAVRDSGRLVVSTVESAYAFAAALLGVVVAGCFVPHRVQLGPLWRGEGGVNPATGCPWGMSLTDRASCVPAWWWVIGRLTVLPFVALVVALVVVVVKDRVTGRVADVGGLVGDAGVAAVGAGGGAGGGGVLERTRTLMDVGVLFAEVRASEQLVGWGFVQAPPVGWRDDVTGSLRVVYATIDQRLALGRRRALVDLVLERVEGSQVVGQEAGPARERLLNAVALAAAQVERYGSRISRLERVYVRCVAAALQAAVEPDRESMSSGRVTWVVESAKAQRADLLV